MGGPIRFESTVWSVVRRAREKSESAARDLVEKYRLPVVLFIERNGFGHEDAEDVAQEVFTRMFRDDVLAKADHARGKFRTLLLAVTRNLMLKEIERRSALKRGGTGKIVSLDDAIREDGEPALAFVSAPPQADEEFDRLWMQHILTLALDQLKRDSHDSGVPYYEAMRMYLKQEMDYQSIAEQLTKSPQDVKNYLHRGRAKLIEYVRDEIAAYSSSQQEYDEELKHLSRHLDGV